MTFAQRFQILRQLQLAFSRLNFRRWGCQHIVQHLSDDVVLESCQFHQSLYHRMESTSPTIEKVVVQTVAHVPLLRTPATERTVKLNPSVSAVVMSFGHIGHAVLFQEFGECHWVFLVLGRSTFLIVQSSMKSRNACLMVMSFERHQRWKFFFSSAGILRIMMSEVFFSLLIFSFPFCNVNSPKSKNDNQNKTIIKVEPKSKSKSFPAPFNFNIPLSYFLFHCDFLKLFRILNIVP